MGTNKISISLCICFFLIVCCSQQGKEVTYNPVTKRYTVCLGAKHKILRDISTANITKLYNPEYLACSGFIKPSSQNQVIVSSPFQGIVKELYVRNGENVEKGKILAIIENAEFISIQENYLSVKSQYEYLREDFKRQGELSLERATSLKVLQQAQNEFNKTEAKLYSLKKTLDIIGIHSDSIRVDNIQSSIALKAPISGKVNLLNTRLGSLSSVENPLCEITGTHGQLLYMQLIESIDVNILPGQLLEFFIKTNPSKTYRSKVFSILPATDNPNQIEVYADIEDSGVGFESGMPVFARISSSNDSVDVLPEEAIVQSGEKEFVILKKYNNCFELIEITAGKSIQKMRQVIEIPKYIQNGDFVVHGSDLIYREIINPAKKIR
jgi:cobalt-zinc-cadmium efflux system membrane fusion protein